MFVLAMLVAVAGCRSIAFDPRLAMEGSRVYVDQASGGSPIAVSNDHLVVMREGRLFSVRIGGGNLEAVDMLELAPARGYHTEDDELRLHGDALIVVRERRVWGGELVDLVRVRIADDGTLAQTDRHTVPGSRGLASSSGSPVIVVGDRLHVYVSTFAERVGADLPPLERRRTRKEARRALRGLLDGAIVAEGLDPQPTHVHAVVTCDLASASLECSTRAILGGTTTAFHVAPDAIYVWTNSPENHGALVRFGLDGGPMSVLPVSGDPVDDDAWAVRHDRVHALVRNAGTDSDLFDYGAISAPLTGPLQYVDLPDPEEQGALKARLVGDTFVYGAGNGAGWVRRDHALGSVRLWTHAIDGETRSLVLPHTVELLDSLGPDAVVVGTRDAALHLTTVGLDGTPSVHARIVMPVRDGERMKARGSFVAPDQGVVGIPMLLGDAVEGVPDRVEVSYFGVAGPHPHGLGSVALRLPPPERCRKRCGGGPSQPVFHEGRAFAMIRHTLTEVAVDGDALVELARVDLRDLE
jgi:hypothetical protein